MNKYVCMGMYPGIVGIDVVSGGIVTQFYGDVEIILPCCD